MSEYEVVPATRRSTRPRWGLVAGTLLLGIGLGLLLFSAFVIRKGLWNPLVSLLQGRSTRIDVSAPSVVDKIRQLSRLETVDYSIDKIVEGDKENPMLPSFLVGDKLLLVAHGEVIAGLDLGQLSPKDVRIQGDTVHVRLPSPRILVTSIDNEKTKVYSRTTGLLVSPDPQLETQARVAAGQEITKAALDDGILNKARQNGQVSVTGLMYALGFHTVEFE